MSDMKTGIMRLFDTHDVLTSCKIAQELGQPSVADCYRALLKLVEEGVLARRPVQFLVKKRITFGHWVRNCAGPPAAVLANPPTIIKILCLLQEMGNASLVQLLPLLGGISRIALHFKLMELRALGLVGVEPLPNCSNRSFLYYWRPGWYEGGDDSVFRLPVGRKIHSPQVLRLLWDRTMSVADLQRNLPNIPKAHVPSYVQALELIGLIESTFVQGEGSEPPVLGYRLADILQPTAEPDDTSLAAE